MRGLSALTALSVMVTPAGGGGGGEIASDGTIADLQTKINAATAGQTITIPAGTHAWATGVTCNKAINIKGQGSGTVQGHSVTSLAIGTGSKAFTIATGTTVDVTNAWANGATVRAFYKPDSTQYMEGTVTSYVGGVLTLNITSVGGSGTKTSWCFLTTASTNITMNQSANGIAFDLTTPASGTLNFYGVRFNPGTAPDTSVKAVQINTGGSGIVVVHDCLFYTNSVYRAILFQTNCGVVYKNYFVGAFDWDARTNNLATGYGVAIKHTANGVWLATSKWGSLDSTYKQFAYIQQNYFFACMTEAADPDDCACADFTGNIFDHSGIASHGADTSNYGLRNCVFQNNVCIFQDLGTATANLNYFVFIRGGAWVITGNTLPDISSGEWGGKPEILLMIEQLQRNSGPHPLWGKDIPGAQYPCPRQPATGYVTGGAGSDAFAYNGDIEPIYQWSNTGTGNYATPTFSNYAAPGAGEDTVTDYLQMARDYFNATHPSYVAQTYPHPLRAA